MEIAFRTKALRALCLEKKAMDDRFGVVEAGHLRLWLADLRAAQSVGDLPLLKFSVIPGDAGDVVSMTIGGNLTAVVKANYQRPPKLGSGLVDWLRVERLLIYTIKYQNE